jgi:hypothetical protein
MNPLALLTDLAAKGVSVLADGEHLSVEGPTAFLTDAVVERLRALKPAVLSTLRRRPACCECRRPIIEDPCAWWGGQPVHLSCGERAWQREWQGSAATRGEVAA